LASDTVSVKGVGKDLQVLGNWHSQFSKFVGYLGALSRQWSKSAPHIQNQAAHIVAELYRAFIRQGVGPENSTLTQILSGVHPPLAGLADYIIVREATNGKPAVVTWDPHWTKIAVLHDIGWVYAPSQKQRNALFARATSIAGLDSDGKPHFLTNDFGTNGLWIYPARPHSHFLKSKEHQAILVRVAQEVLAGRKVPDFSTSRPSASAWRPLIQVNADMMASHAHGHEAVESALPASTPHAPAGPKKSTRAGQVIRRAKR
jgi:hypothetical protein